MHDYCKEFTSESIVELARSYRSDIQVQPINAIFHGMAATQYAIEHFGLQDTEIAEAVVIHTMGACQMSDQVRLSL